MPTGILRISDIWSRYYFVKYIYTSTYTTILIFVVIRAYEKWNHNKSGGSLIPCDVTNSIKKYFKLSSML